MSQPMSGYKLVSIHILGYSIQDVFFSRTLFHYFFAQILFRKETFILRESLDVI